MPLRLLAALALFGATTAIADPAPAPSGNTLIGDTLTFLRAYPSPGTPYGQPPQTGQTTTVEGDGDRLSWSGDGGWGPESGTVYARFDPEAYGIYVSLPNAGGYIDTGPDFFDGYVISGFDHDIVGASASYDGLTFSWTSRELRLDFLGTIPAGEFTIKLQLASDQAVPEPGAAGLVGVALLLAAGVRRSRSRA
jgi:hypothetical protein